MNCPDPICRLITCPVTDDLPAYLGQYNLQSGLQFVSLEISVPGTDGFYIVPPGAIVINLPPNPTVVAYQGCASMVSENIPPGSTPAQIQQIVSQVMTQVAAQLPGCNAPKPVFNPSLVGSFSNGPVTLGCGGGMSLSQVGDLPAGVTFSISGLTLIGGVFSSSISQADADIIAEDYLSTFFGNEVICGWWNTQQVAMCCDGTTQTVAADTIFSTVSQADADAQALSQATAACPTCYWNTEQSFTCPDMSVKTVPAHTYMSTVSQAAADALALAAAEAQCPAADCSGAISALTWTPVSVDPTGNNFAIITGNNIHVGADGGFTIGSVTVTTSITNSNSSDCLYKWVVIGPSGTPTVVDGGGSAGFVKMNGTTVATNATPYPGSFSFTVPAMSTLSVSIEALAGTLGGSASFNVTLMVGP